MKNLLLIIAFLVVVALSAFFVLPFIQDQRDKASLMKGFEGLPIFSENNTCMVRFRPKSVMNEAGVGCEYIPLYGFNATIEKYDIYLKDSGWIFYSKAQNEEGFYYKKDKYLLSIGIPSRIRAETIDTGDNGEIITRTNDTLKNNPYITIGVGFKSF